MTNGKAQPAPNTAPKWKDALLWAILAALLFQLAENYILGKTVWQRLDQVERDVRGIENMLPMPPRTP